MDPDRKAVWYIESFLAEVTLEDIAASVAVSRFHLTGAFRIATGKSVMRYVRARRLSEAASRLASGEKNFLNLQLHTPISPMKLSLAPSEISLA